MVFFEASGGSTANPILGAAFICVSLAAITSWLGGERPFWLVDGMVISLIPSRQRCHIPPNGKFGKSSTQNAIFGGYVSSLEGISVRFKKESSILTIHFQGQAVSFWGEKTCEHEEMGSSWNMNCFE